MRLRIVVGLLIMVGLMAAQAGTVKVAGQGELLADGNGAAMLRGSGKMKIEGQGTLWYKGDGQLTTTGEVASETVGEWTLILGFNGSAEVKGTDLRLSLSGKNIKVSAVGTGKAMFWGKGTFSAHRRSGTWDVKWTVIPYTEGPKKKEKTKATDTQGS